MPYKITESELDMIVHIITSSPTGASIGELMRNDELTYSRRTLHRRLDLLTERGQLIARGEGRSRRYIGPQATEISKESAAVPSLATVDGDWLSREALEIRQQVRQPLSKRHPVGYNASFLANYTPNVTYYLPSETRAELMKIGQVGISDLPAGTYLRQILDRLLVDLAWNSSRLEGNTYSLLETQQLLERGENAIGKQTKETQMILNHKAAIEMLADQAEEIGFNRYTICNLHSLLSDNLLSNPAACGRLRDRSVGISGSVFHPLEVPQQIEEKFLLIMNKAEAIEDPFEAAFFVMVHLPYLQAFEDVNKRVSRLAANTPLIRHNLCPLSFVDVETQDYLEALIGIYELNRVEYMRDVFVWAYTRSTQLYTAVRQSLGDPDPFRLKFRTQIGELVRRIVHSGTGKTEASKLLKSAVEQQIEEPDRERFIEVLEIELNCLHEGNIARYRLTPNEFSLWKASWI